MKKKSETLIPVPRREIKYTKQNPLSKILRDFDNLSIDTPFLSQSGIYLNTNELGASTSYRKLGLFPPIYQPLHFGFSGLHNFDIIAKRQSSRAVICDINPENALFISYVLKALTRCKDRLSFIENITQYMKKHCYEGNRTNVQRDPFLNVVAPKSLKFCLNVSNQYPYNEECDHYSVFDEMKLELKRETSWLYDESRFNHLRRLALEDKIVLITESICEPNTFLALCKVLKDNMEQIDTLYLSNIAQWMHQQSDRDAFLKTVKILLSDQNTIIIDAIVNENGNENENENGKEQVLATQRCISAKEVLTLSIENWFFPSNDPQTLDLLDKN
ncbi:hypothetical protein [Legionella sp. W05-934-2]|jgi:hypothetical protein|uniref:LIC_10091 family protein n=1 Tax=Legionella sp. W05-934-2 TaxID=1198649 RepID=UPI003462E51F